MSDTQQTSKERLISLLREIAAGHESDSIRDLAEDSLQEIERLRADLAEVIGDRGRRVSYLSSTIERLERERNEAVDAANRLRAEIAAAPPPVDFGSLLWNELHPQPDVEIETLTKEVQRLQSLVEEYEAADTSQQPYEKGWQDGRADAWEAYNAEPPSASRDLIPELERLVKATKDWDGTTSGTLQTLVARHRLLAAETCGACDKPDEFCSNQHGICSRVGGQAHETSPECPRPFNSRPDDFTEQQCKAAGECGCNAVETSGSRE